MAKGFKTGGRRKGAANVLSADLRAMILESLDLAGGKDYLLAQAIANPQAFIGLIGKVVPKDVTLRTDGTLNLSIKLGS